jgi:hypothetical protein
MSKNVNLGLMMVKILVLNAVTYPVTELILPLNFKAWNFIS